MKNSQQNAKTQQTKTPQTQFNTHPTKQLLATWPKIADIYDQDLGFTKDKNSPKIRYTVRVLPVNDHGQICFVHSAKYNFLQILGGGINKGETIEQAAHREIHEEGGIEISNLKPLGYIIEHRQNRQQPYDWGRNISFAFTATAGRYIGTNYMPDELEDGFEPIWLTPEDALSRLKTKDNQRRTHYGGAFSTHRDLHILQEFISRTQSPASRELHSP